MIIEMSFVSLYFILVIYYIIVRSLFLLCTMLRKICVLYGSVVYLYIYEAVLTSTHNLCFGSKITKIGIPLQIPVFST